MPSARRLAYSLLGVFSLFGLAACGGTNTSGFDSGVGDEGGHHGGGRDATMGDKDGNGIHLLPDGGAQPDARCSGIACDVASCPGGSETTVTGYTYAPNGTLPLYDVQVYIPNAPLMPLMQGVQCQNCGTPLSGEPIATALSDPTGAFKLVGVPTGTDIPIVVQLGKWRRQTTIPKVTACSTTVLTDPSLTRLPANQMEGNMPHIALTTGGCDQMGCMLPKIGIDPIEFGSQTDGYNKAVNVYYGSGGGMPTPATTQAMNVWGDATVMNTYDLAIFSCECDESLYSKGGIGLGGAPFKVVTDYLNAGGRIFTTDFQYTWYKYSPDPMIGETVSGSPITGIGDIAGGAPVPFSQSPMVLSTTLPKAEALSAWLKYVFSGVPLPSGTTFPLDGPSQMNEIAPDVVFCNVQSLSSEAVLYASSDQTSGGCTGSSPGPRIFTVDTPVEDKPAMQCGRGVHLDAHVDNGAGNSVGPGYPTTGCSTTLKADEAAFAFFFFDLSSCISDEHEPPMPPPPVK